MPPPSKKEQVQAKQQQPKKVNQPKTAQQQRAVSADSVLRKPEEQKQKKREKNNASKPQAKLEKPQQNAVENVLPGAELPDLYDLDFQIETSLKEWDSRVNNHLFRPSALRRFLQTSLAEVNSKYSLSTVTLQYYSMALQQFLIPRIAFAHWDIQNDHSDQFEYWPDALKMDYFMEQSWKENYEDDARRAFIYTLK